MSKDCLCLVLVNVLSDGSEYCPECGKVWKSKKERSDATVFVVGPPAALGES